MAEVAERGGAKRRHAKHLPYSAGSGARDAGFARRRCERAVAEKEDEHRADEREQRRRDQDRLPWPARAARAQRMRHGRAERQHADEPAERSCRSTADPLHDHLHAERIDAGQTKTDGEAQRPRRRVLDARQRQGGVGRRAGDAADREDAAGTEAIGRSGRCEGERAGDEAELRRRDEPAERCAVDGEARHQAIRCTARAEPERSAEPLRQDHQRDRRALAARDGRQFNRIGQAPAPGRR